MSTTVRLDHRATAFMQAFPHPAAWPHIVTEQGHQVLYATWLLGNNYQNKSGYYGSYPPGFLDRVMAFFPDAGARDILHAFSGSLPAGDYSRCDSHQPAEYRCDVQQLPNELNPRKKFALVVADPPYSKADAERYGTPMIDRRLVTRALAEITQPGGHLAWLDCVWPMHAKAQWTTVGRITIIRSTNHRVRLLTLFERTAAATGDGTAPHARRDGA